MEKEKVFFSEEKFEAPRLGLYGRRDVDYRIRWRRGKIPILVMAPHGGKIEPGTSYFADKIAGNVFWFYAFEGIRSSENYKFLHIPSTLFNEPLWKSISKRVYITLTIHGMKSDSDIVLGGKYKEGCDLVRSVLQYHGFNVRKPPDYTVAGTHQNNVANINKLKKGIQLEVGKSIRNSKSSQFIKAVRKGLENIIHAWNKEGRFP